MSNCWNEGDLRASLDGELDATAVTRLNAHLAECGSCVASREELARRASRVAVAMATLEEGVLATVIPISPVRPIHPIRNSRNVWRNPAAIGAMAAGLAIIALTLPHHPASKDTQGANATSPNPVASLTPPDVPAQRVSQTHPRHARPEPRAVSFPIATPAVTQATLQQTDTDHSYFLALDDEPIETGIVMRVASPSGDFQADVIVGPDGRAHAIRIVTDGN